MIRGFAALVIRPNVAAFSAVLIYATDVGWNKNGAGQQLRCATPGTFITSGGTATMGFAPAAAIGANLAVPHRRVICLVGDGGFLSVVGALTTAVELNVPVLWILFDNFCFSTIRTVGANYFNNSYGTEFATLDKAPYNPDFTLLARAFGMDIYSKYAHEETCPCPVQGIGTWTIS